MEENDQLMTDEEIEEVAIGDALFIARAYLKTIIKLYPSELTEKYQKYIVRLDKKEYESVRFELSKDAILFYAGPEKVSRQTDSILKIGKWVPTALLKEDITLEFIESITSSMDPLSISFLVEVIKYNRYYDSFSDSLKLYLEVF